MKTYTRLNQFLNSDCIATLPNIHNKEVIDKINKAVSPLLNAQDGNRTYVSAIELLELGLLDDIFSPTFLSMLFDLVEDPELYHCHIYEIAAKQSQPHIKADNYLGGWHRDTDCKHNFSRSNLQHISFFVYLSDVKEQSGCFEVSNRKLNLIPFFNRKETCFKLLGEKGTNFFFDRKSFHRASPNESDTPRRVLKISIQSRQIFNHKKQEQVFQLVRDKLPKQALILQQLFGAKIPNQQLSQPLLDKVENDNLDRHVQLPSARFSLHFSFKQKMTRWYRDFRFILRRLAVQYIGLNDNKVPSPKITYKKLRG